MVPRTMTRVPSKPRWPAVAPQLMAKCCAMPCGLERGRRGGRSEGWSESGGVSRWKWRINEGSGRRCASLTLRSQATQSEKGTSSESGCHRLEHRPGSQVPPGPYKRFECAKNQQPTTTTTNKQTNKQTNQPTKTKQTKNKTNKTRQHKAKQTKETQPTNQPTNQPASQPTNHSNSCYARARLTTKAVSTCRFTHEHLSGGLPMLGSSKDFSGYQHHEPQKTSAPKNCGCGCGSAHIPTKQPVDTKLRPISGGSSRPSNPRTTCRTDGNATDARRTAHGRAATERLLLWRGSGAPDWIHATCAGDRAQGHRKQTWRPSKKVVSGILEAMAN